MINSPRFGDDNGDVSIPDKDGENEKSGDDESGEKEKLGDDEGGEKDPTGEKPESPEAELPEANVINLDFSTVEIDDVQFNLPTELAVEVVTAYRSASSLTAKDWLVLAKRGRVTRGIHLDRALAGRSADDAVADEAAFDWHYDRDRNFLGLQPTSKVETSIVYTSTVSNLVHNRIASASLTFDSPFVAGAATANRNEMQAKSQVRKRLFMTGA